MDSSLTIHKNEKLFSKLSEKLFPNTFLGKWTSLKQMTVQFQAFSPLVDRLILLSYFY